MSTDLVVALTRLETQRIYDVHMAARTMFEGSREAARARDDASAGAIIRNQAGALGADLVVMGLYGRSRLQEMVLGGAVKC